MYIDHNKFAATLRYRGQ